MKNLEDIKLKAKERGYVLQLRNANNSELFYNKDNIVLTLYPKIEGFSLSFYIDDLINLETLQCGSFMDDEHFKEIESNFIKYVEKISI